MCLNHNLKNIFCRFFGVGRSCVSTIKFEVNHVFKPSLVFLIQKGFFLQKEAFLKNVDHVFKTNQVNHMFKPGRSYVKTT